MKARFRNTDGVLNLEGTTYFTGSEDELLTEIDSLAHGDRPALIVTANVDHTTKFLAGEPARTILGSADLVTLDGAPLVVVAKLLGIPHAHRNTGSDLLLRTSADAVGRGWRIAMVGGSDETGALAETNLRIKHPGASITHVSLPLLESPEDPASTPALDELRQLAPHVIFLCLGFPKQELWFQAWKDRLPSGAYIGAGAAVDFAAGTRARAPRAVQRAGGEWLWRIAQEPRRLARRYLVDSVPFIGLAFRSIAKKGQP